MRYSDVARSLRELPDPLPAAPRELMPMLLVAESDAFASSPARSGTGRMPEWPPVAREAAALVLLYPDEAGEAHVLLIERTRGEYRHSGEVSFPGGAVDEGDTSLEAAALREAHEEVGLDPATDGLWVVGRLESVEIRVSGFRLTPVLALAGTMPLRLTPNPREVASILAVPLRHFLPGAPIEIVEAERDGVRLRYGGFMWGDHHIWGATAKVLGQLGAVVSR